MPRIQTNSIELAYEIHGSGPPLVLITGVGYGQWFWRWIVPLLARDFQVITLDNRGVGESTKAPGPYTVRMMAEDTLGLLDGLGIRSTHLLGLSLGGLIAQEVVFQRPELVCKLVLGATTFGGRNTLPVSPAALEVMTNREGTLLDRIQRGISIAAAPGFPARKPEVIQELVQYRLGTPCPGPQYAAQVEAGAATARYSDAEVKQRVSAIRVPTVLLWGDQDQVVPLENAHRMAKTIPTARIRLIPGAGHIFPIEAPEVAAGVLRDFLRSPEGSIPTQKSPTPCTSF